MLLNGTTIKFFYRRELYNSLYSIFYCILDHIILSLQAMLLLAVFLLALWCQQYWYSVVLSVVYIRYITLFLQEYVFFFLSWSRQICLKGIVLSVKFLSQSIFSSLGHLEVVTEAASKTIQSNQWGWLPAASHQVEF